MPLLNNFFKKPLKDQTQLITSTLIRMMLKAWKALATIPPDLVGVVRPGPIPTWLPTCSIFSVAVLVKFVWFKVRSWWLKLTDWRIREIRLLKPSSRVLTGQLKRHLQLPFQWENCLGVLGEDFLTDVWKPAPRDLFTGNFSSNKFLSPALAQKEWREAGVYCHFHDLCGLCPDLWLSFIPPSWSGGWEILGSEIYQEAPRTGAHSRPLASVGCDEDDDNNTDNSLSSGQCEFWLLWSRTAWLSFQWLKIHTLSFSCMETTIFFMIRGLLMLISIFW